jgi:hypothetical protein
MGFVLPLSSFLNLSRFGILDYYFGSVTNQKVFAVIGLISEVVFKILWFATVGCCLKYCKPSCCHVTERQPYSWLKFGYEIALVLDGATKNNY